MVDSIEKSYYSSVNGLIFVFDINVLLSINFIEKIRLELNEAKGSINSELLFEIALYINEDEKINEIRNEFKFSVFTFSLKTGENVDVMFYFLTKRIVQSRKNSQLSQPNQNVKYQGKSLIPYFTETVAGKRYIKQRYYYCYTCFPSAKK